MKDGVAALAEKRRTETAKAKRRRASSAAVAAPVDAVALHEAVLGEMLAELRPFLDAATGMLPAAPSDAGSAATPRRTSNEPLPTAGALCNALLASGGLLSVASQLRRAESQGTRAPPSSGGQGGTFNELWSTLADLAGVAVNQGGGGSAGIVVDRTFTATRGAALLGLAHGSSSLVVTDAPRVHTVVRCVLGRLQSALAGPVESEAAADTAHATTDVVEAMLVGHTAGAALGCIAAAAGRALPDVGGHGALGAAAVASDERVALVRLVVGQITTLIIGAPFATLSEGAADGSPDISRALFSPTDADAAQGQSAALAAAAKRSSEAPVV